MVSSPPYFVPRTLYPVPRTLYPVPRTPGVFSLHSICSPPLSRPELDKLRTKSVQKIRDFLVQRVASLRKRMTNIQILQQSVC